MNSDELLDYAGIAALTGLTPATLRHYKTIGLLPEPDASPVPDRPRWRASTIRNWQATRPGRGRRRATSDLPKSDPACDWEGHADALDEHGWCPVCQH